MQPLSVPDPVDCFLPSERLRGLPQTCGFSFLMLSRESGAIFPGAFLVKKSLFLVKALEVDSPGLFFRFCQLLALWLGTFGLGKDISGQSLGMEQARGIHPVEGGRGKGDSKWD